MSYIPLLAACAIPHGDAATDERLHALVAQVDDWSGLAAEAERHGMGPLAYRRLREAVAALPPEISAALVGLYLRSRHDNLVRAQVLQRVTEALADAGIPTLVVKGGALAQIIYAEPALRPMSDLDLLVRPDDLGAAAEVLLELGMGSARPEEGQHGKGLGTAGTVVDGTWVGIELHTDLFEEGFPASLTMQELRLAPLAFTLGPGGTPAQTLGVEELLWHLCLHLQFHTTVFLPWRLIWVADILRVAQGAAGEVDWALVRRDYPQVLRTLSLVDCLCPLGEATRERIGLARRRTPSGIGEDFRGWPRFAIADQRSKGPVGILRDTLAPSDWWLRLHAGLDADTLIWRQRWLAHPVDIARRAIGMYRAERATRRAGSPGDRQSDG